MSTNKVVLYKGIKWMGYALPLLFIGPSLIHMSFKNQQHPMYIPILSLGILLCVLSIFLIFKGLKTIMKSLFDGN
ncbi:DUF6095 family protein [Flavobacterium sp. GCM10027622]|uniref:DUF6095 family protein n=1 Tax=unclassified Flavobacterium TaxID=196869 RepID=UPI00360ADAB0